MSGLFEEMWDEISEKNIKIADLKAKLAESEARIACREDNIKFKEADINQLKWFLEGKKKDIEQLKQRLEEKNQAIEGLQEINKSLGQTCNNDAKEIERLREQLKLAKMGESFEQEKKNNALKSQNQTAIAELTRVKEWLEPKYFDKEQINYLANVIDQQIAELKGEM